jgi:MOB kinase activator 1
LAFREYELYDIKDVKGATNASVGIGLLWDKWKEMDILEG